MDLAHFAHQKKPAAGPLAEAPPPPEGLDWGWSPSVTATLWLAGGPGSRRRSLGDHSASCQALSVKDSEKAVLLEKLLATQQSLARVTVELEKQKRESHSRQEQERVGGPVGPGWARGRAELFSADRTNCGTQASCKRFPQLSPPGLFWATGGLH